MNKQYLVTLGDTPLTRSDLRWAIDILRDSAAFEFCEPDQLRERLKPNVWRRADFALRSARSDQTVYLHNGLEL